jgi:hypothetical protein
MLPCNRSHVRSSAVAKDGGSGVGLVAKSFYLINPRESVPGYFGLEVSSQAIGGLKVLVADLTTTTVAALMPSDWRVALCDER